MSFGGATSHHLKESGCPGIHFLIRISPRQSSKVSWDSTPNPCWPKKVILVVTVTEKTTSLKFNRKVTFPKEQKVVFQASFVRGYLTGWKLSMVINKLVVSTHLKNISQIGSFTQVGMNIENIWNHDLVTTVLNHAPAIIGRILQAAPETPHRTTPNPQVDPMWVPQRLAQLRVVLTGAKALLGQHDDLRNLQRSDPLNERTPKKPEYLIAWSQLPLVGSVGKVPFQYFDRDLRVTCQKHPNISIVGRE